MKPRSSHIKIPYLFVTFIFMAALFGGPNCTMHGASSVVPLNASSYIVQGTDFDQVVNLVEQYGGRITSRLEIINGVGADLSQTTVNELLSESSITAITPNFQMKIDSTLVESSPQGGRNIPETNYPNITGATAVWEAGVIGDGIGVAILDTGITQHQGLKKMLTAKMDALSAGQTLFRVKKLPVIPMVMALISLA